MLWWAWLFASIAMAVIVPLPHGFLNGWRYVCWLNFVFWRCSNRCCSDRTDPGDIKSARLIRCCAFPVLLNRGVHLLLRHESYYWRSGFLWTRESPNQHILDNTRSGTCIWSQISADQQFMHDTVISMTIFFYNFCAYRYLFRSPSY